MRAAAAATILVSAVLIIYRASTAAYFFDDDFHWLQQTQPFVLARLLDLSRYDHFYRPVIELYFWAGLSAFGCAPFPFHVVSIAIHLLTVALVYGFARTISGSSTFAFLSSLFFAVQPGFTDAITWVGAITDLLPVPAYVLTLWLHQRYLRAPLGRWYAAALASFLVCHLTHESAATLLPMMLLADLTFTGRGPTRDGIVAIARRWVHYAPFALILAAFLLVAYVVNTRSYLVQDGHYAFGWHAVPNIVHYIIWLYVGERAPLDYVGTAVVLAAVLIWGSPRMRFSIAWIAVTLLPVSFFTWENAPRYLYLPAVGFAMLVADLMLALRRLLAVRMSPRSAQVAVAAVIAVLTIRFGLFAKKAADSFPERTAAYERFARELRRTNPNAVAGSSVLIDRQFLEGIPELYRQPAAAGVFCLPDVRLEMR